MLVQSKPARTALQTQANSSSVAEVIDDAEEADRVSQMLQRDSLVRGLGVVELVHRVLRSVHNNDLTSPFTADTTGGATVPPPNHVSVTLPPSG